MNYSIDKKSNEKAYMQLYFRLKRDITDGVWQYGTKLPSKRLLAAETGVSVITIEHTYDLLCEEGYARSVQRSGYFVIYKATDFLSTNEVYETHHNFKTHQYVSDSSISFAILARTMRKVMLDYGDSILVKSPNHGCIELRCAIAAYLRRSQGIVVSSEQIIIGSGAEYLYSLIAQIFAGHIVAIENPSYPKIRRVYEACSVSYDMLRLSSDGIRSGELCRTRADILHITPFNSFPSGITATASKRAEYLRWADSKQGYIIEDNYDSELTVSTKNESTLFSSSVEGRVIYMNTFSKTIAPSVRIGYMVLPKQLIPLFEKKVGFYSCTVPVFEQYVLTQLLNSGDFERHINRVRRNKRKNLKKNA